MSENRNDIRNQATVFLVLEFLPPGGLWAVFGHFIDDIDGVDNIWKSVLHATSSFFSASSPEGTNPMQRTMAEKASMME